MQFRREIQTAELLNPAKGYGRESKQIEYRYDPLTGAQCRINQSRSRRVRQAQGEAVEVAALVEGTQRGCFFCPDSIEGSTSKFPAELCPEGRIRRGECVLFPNLYPFAEHHAVATLTRQHYLEIDEFDTGMLRDNIAASQEYIARVYQRDKGARYHVWMWNYLPPSGASIIHPHVQVIVDRSPMPGLDLVLAKSEEYDRNRGRNYWLELIQVERDSGERFIVEDDTLAIVASFAPRGNREVQFIFKGASHLCDLNEAQTLDFADAIVMVLRCYKAQEGVNSFNLITCAAPLGDRMEHFRMSARIFSRPAFQPLYTNDTGPIERLYGTSVIETLPEDVAREMRDAFSI
jgi:UDPglucose--hexose-1-phosphate uridylyltransferase